MPFDEMRAPLVTLLCQPIAVASLVVLAGIHAAIWLLVFERVGFPPVLASLTIFPPLTFLLPLYVALARWPSQKLARSRAPQRVVQPRTVQQRSMHRPVQQQHAAHPVTRYFAHPGPLRLAADGLPRVRIPLPPESLAQQWPARKPVGPSYSQRTDLWPPET